jgi:acyl-CoA reductase-like NAD-dependent aldehyde dehydrogenase
MSGETLTTISPSTNQPIVTRKAASPEEIAKLPSIAQEAVIAYHRSYPTLSSRQKIIAKALQLLHEKQDELAKELTEQMGRPIAYTAKEITTAVKRGEYLNSIAGDILGQDVPGEEETGFRRFIRREPVGVVLVLFAWNVREPSLQMCGKMLGLTLTSLVPIFNPRQLINTCPFGWQRRHPQTLSSDPHSCRTYLTSLCSGRPSPKSDPVLPLRID